MDWIAGLDVVIKRTGHTDMRRLCDASHPDHKQWRAQVLAQAQAPAPVAPTSRPPNALPPLHLPSHQIMVNAQPIKLLQINTGQTGGGCCGGTPVPVRTALVEPITGVSRPVKLESEVVVARYNENVSWLDGLPHFITLYNKGQTSPTLGRPCHIKSLPNRGREAGTWLYHIITNYDSLADWTYFLQGDAKKHQPDILERTRAEYKCLSCLSTRYEERSPLPVVKAQDMVWVDNDAGFEMRLGNATAQVHYNIPKWFNIKAWDYVFTGPMPDPLWFCYSAQWAVPATTIRSRSRAFYAWLLENLTEDGEKTITIPPTNPWSLEALWRYIWDPSYETRVK